MSAEFVQRCRASRCAQRDCEQIIHVKRRFPRSRRRSQILTDRRRDDRASIAGPFIARWLMTVLTAARARRTRRTRLDGPLSPTRQIGINIYTQARVSRGLTEVLQPFPNPSQYRSPRERDGIEDPREGNAHSAFLREVFRDSRSLDSFDSLFHSRAT